ncbi:MAG: ATP-binding protein [Melioribacter sp.]|nr:ATP-binding protein [Melioribacter sp.]
MGKSIKTRPSSKTLELKVQGFIKEENKKQLLSPFRSLATFTAAAGIVALIFEVLYFSEHSVQLYISRVASVLIAFILLIVSNSKFGKNHPVLLVHILLLSIVASFGVMTYLEPHTLVFNSHIISLIIFTAALFLSWEVKNQIIVAIYYNLVFIASIIFNNPSISSIPNMIESIVLVLIISVMAIVASYINYRLRHEALLKSYEVILSEKKFRNLFENSTEGIFQILPSGKFTAVNPAFVKLIGYTNEDDVYKLNFIDDLFKRKADWDLLHKLLEKQGKVRNYRVHFQKKDGSEITVRINIRISYDEDEDITYYEGSVQDITQQVQAENERQKALEALRQEKLKSDIAAQKAQQESSYKSKFLANMSHEVRTPMNSVMGFLTLIENDLFESKEELKSFARDARLAAESLLDIINNILDISKIEAGKMELDINEFNIRDEIHKVYSIMGQAARQKGIELEEEVDHEIPEKIYGDSTRYRQIVLNLVGNAVKFTDEGKVKITVKLNSRTINTVEILTSVEDTGHGIPPEKIPFLFEPYVQVRSKKDKKEGTGLGLVIAKEFVKLMGGDIKVESKPGLGSKFYFNAFFRLSPPDKIEEEKIETPLAKESQKEELVIEDAKKFEQKKKKLLLVEDNPISQNLETKILREVGYDVDAVSNGQDAIDAIKTGQYDLVLMDIEMTDMDGITATKKIREIPGDIGKIPIIAVTAHSSMKDREKCLAAGMNDYIAKPINIHFLKLTIDQWLNRPYRD